MFRLLWILLLVALYFAGYSSAETRPQSIKVVMDNNYPPYVFIDSAGELQGILIDQWRLWEKKSGITVEIHAMDWGKAISGMKAGEFDVIDTIFKTEERSGWLDFSRPYADINVPIFFDKNISGITDIASLKGFPVATKAGDAAIDLLMRSGVDNLMLFNSYEAVILAAKEHKVSIFVVDAPPALYFLYKFDELVKSQNQQ
jgi:two-component system cell cycle sensor histidine kinase/response regulator CckA